MFNKIPSPLNTPQINQSLNTQLNVTPDTGTKTDPHNPPKLPRSTFLVAEGYFQDSFFGMPSIVSFNQNR